MNNNLPSYNELPELFAINLNSIGAITLTGEEQIKYLQGQVTCDVANLEQEKLLTGAHCNAKGKVFDYLSARVNFFLFNLNHRFNSR